MAIAPPRHRIEASGTRPPGDQAGRDPGRPGCLGTAMLRCGLYLGPLSVAITAAGQLRRAPWIVPVVVLVLGWSTTQAMTSVGTTVARRFGPAAGARVVGRGFLAAAVVWAALVWVAPAGLLGGGRWLAAGIGAGGLAVLATVSAALVTRAETAVIRWSLPCWLLAASTVAASLGDDWAALLRTDPVPTGAVLLVVILIALGRSFRPAVARRAPQRPRLARPVIRRGSGFAVIGAAQAAAVILLWRSGPSDVLSPAAFPLLVSVPLIEALVAWNVRQAAAGLDLTDSRAGYRQHLRRVTTVTVMGLLLPLAVGGALAVAAYRLPYGVTAAVTTRDGVLALAAGTLLSGVLAGTFLLAARGRTVLAAALAVAPPTAILAAPLLPAASPGRLALFVVVLTATHLAGLLTVAHTAADHRRTP